MPGIFDKTSFNAEVFAGYIGRIPNLKKDAMIKSRAIRPRPELADAMKEQGGTLYLTTSLTGTISGTEPQNYDGVTDMESNGTETYNHSRIVVGRMQSWTEDDFTVDISGGKDFMEDIAAQVSEYWSEVDQDTILYILKGIFSMTGEANQEFVTKHTYNITEKTNSEGKTGYADATTLNSCMQQACGDNKSAFSMALMCSTVATNLENLKLLTHLKYNDADGMERDIGIASLSGKLVLVDDDMPSKAVGDGKVEYTTYVLGDNAIEYTDCGAKVPYEVGRDPRKHGGQDALFSRQRKSYAPWGISYTMKRQARKSPTPAELSNGENWELVHSVSEDEEAQIKYINHKAIPIARIISYG